MTLDELTRARHFVRMGVLERLCVASVALCLSSTALADDAVICTDRPSKGTSTCTVPAGVWQVETGLADWSHSRVDADSSDFTTIGSSLIKYGLTDRADIELGLNPLLIARTEHHSTSGFGDTLVRAKYRLTGQDATISAALDPFVKLPTANHRLGNGKVEAGLVTAISAPIGKSPFSLSLAPELDWRADGDGDGHHAAMIQLMNLGLAASSKLSFSAELWGQWDWDPAGTMKQASADASIAYDVTNDVQLDGGVNLGLNRETPDIELYAGISARF